ncbi:MAG: hypothetical protein ACK551_08710 [Vampirovibrionales bacterium]
MRVSNPFSMPQSIPTKFSGQTANVDNRNTLQRMGRLYLSEPIENTMLADYIDGRHPNMEKIAEGLNQLGTSVATLLNLMLPHQETFVDSNLGNSFPSTKGLQIEGQDAVNSLEAFHQQSLSPQYLYVTPSQGSSDLVGLAISPAKLYIFTDILDKSGEAMPIIEKSVIQTILTKLYELTLLSGSQLSKMKVYDTTNPLASLEYTPVITEEGEVSLS